MADTSRPDVSGEHPVVAATPARQGRYGRRVFWVLVISTALAAIGLLLAWSWKAPSLSRPGPPSAASPSAPYGANQTAPAAPAAQTP